MIIASVNVAESKQPGWCVDRCGCFDCQMMSKWRYNGFNVSFDARGNEAEKCRWAQEKRLLGLRLFRWLMLLPWRYRLRLRLLSRLSTGGGVLSGEFLRFSEVFTHVGPQSAILFLLFVFFYQRFALGKPCLRSALVLAVFVAVVTVFAKSFAAYDDWRLVLGSKFQIVLSIVQIAGYSSLYYAMTAALYRFLDRKQGLVPADLDSSRNRIRFLVTFFWNHFGICSCLLILLAWLPMLILYFPGSVPWDGARQLNVAFGFYPLSNHDPLLITYLYGALMSIGKVLGGTDAWGLFFVIAIQAAFCAAAMAVCCRTFENENLPRPMIVGALVYFMLNPVLCCYSSTLLKDVLSAALFLLFATMVFCIWRRRNEKGLRVPTWLLFVACGIALSLSRNNCIYVVVATIAVMFVAWKRQRLGLVCSGVLIVSSFVLWNFLALPALGAQPGKVTEALSIPLEQTARYVTKYPEEVSELEKTAIDGILRYDEIADNYTSDSSDLIRRLLRTPISSEAYRQYFGTWLSMFCKHPEVYIEATMAQTVGYFYPQLTRYNDTHMLNERSEVLDKGEYDVPFVFDEKARKEIAIIARTAVHIPVLGLFQTAGLYTWIALLTLFYVLHRRKWSALPVLVPMIMTIFVCMASPLNGSLRYMLPVVITVPVMISICMFLGEDEKEAIG